MQDARDLVAILSDVNDALRAIRHASDGVSPEKPVEAVVWLGELAGEIEAYRNDQARVAIRSPGRK